MGAPIVEPLSKHSLQYSREDWHMAWQTQVSYDQLALLARLRHVMTSTLVHQSHTPSSSLVSWHTCQSAVLMRCFACVLSAIAYMSQLCVLYVC